MTTSAIIVHQMPGRIRLRIADKCRDENFFSRLAQQLASIDGIQRVKTNPVTGSVVIEFSDTLTSLLQKIQEQAFNIDIQYRVEGRQFPSVSKEVSIKPLNLVSGRQLNLFFMVGSLFTAVGVIQVFRGKILVPAVSFFGFAMDAFRHSEKLGK